jgi:hypothetical protein
VINPSISFAVFLKQAIIICCFRPLRISVKIEVILIGDKVKKQIHNPKLLFWRSLFFLGREIKIAGNPGENDFTPGLDQIGI